MCLFQITVYGVGGCCENVWECATSVTRSRLGWGGGCRDMWGLAWEDPDQFPGSISFSSPLPPAQAPTLGDAWRAWLWCDDVTRVARTSLSHYAGVLVTLPHLPGSGVGWEVVAGAETSSEPELASECIGAWLSPTLLWRPGLVNIIPHTCTRQSRGTNHHCAVCAEDWYSVWSIRVDYWKSLRKIINPGSYFPPSLSPFKQLEVRCESYCHEDHLERP